LREEVSELEIEPKILRVNTCYNRFHQFCQKFEETIERLSLALEEAKAEEEIQKFESESEMYFNLITEVTGRKEELKLYEQMLQVKQKTETMKLNRQL
jgi:DNA polymerase II small subunit/DNA polymerase delta subunit B